MESTRTCILQQCENTTCMIQNLTRTKKSITLKMFIAIKYKDKLYLLLLMV